MWSRSPDVNGMLASSNGNNTASRTRGWGYPFCTSIMAAPDLSDSISLRCNRDGESEPCSVATAAPAAALLS